jgi:phage nucleotide-binding protein
MSDKTLLDRTKALPPLIKKASELPPRKLRMLIYGDAGVGKTTLLATLPRPCLVIDFEGGADLRLRGEEDIYVAEVGNKEDLKKVLGALNQIPGLKAVAFDGFSIFVERLLKDIVEKRRKAGKLRGDSPGFYEWGQLSAQAKEVVLSLLKSDAHVVFTALAKSKVDNDTGEVLELRPDLPKSIRRTLRAVMDMEGYLYADHEGVRKIVFQSKKGITEVKDRSGKLSVEPANLSIVINKVYGGS